ncbi:MAG TPA: hypothetical protein VK788_14010 [Terriglobales bacterium]|jgi:hypothetical protein|nr:hypothetical protein [Terriglobales bacterium]
MKTLTLLRVLCVTVAMILLCGASSSVLAQRGGHGGGGGFHAGAGGGHYGYGGGYYGGYHGGGYGWHGGYGWNGGYGWRGGYWGYPRYGYGWGFGIGFGWGPYWPNYPYAYGYGPWWGAPYNYYPYNYYPCAYPYYPPSNCPYPYNGTGSGSAQDPGWNGYDKSPAKPSGIPARESFPSAASVIDVAASTRTTSTYKTDAATGAALYRLAFTMQELPPARKGVQNVILALRAMPPDARQRQIDSGRYGSFSPEEINLLRSSSHLPITW